MSLFDDLDNANYGENFEQGKPNNSNNSNENVSVPINFNLVGELAYEFGTTLTNHIENLTYNESFFALMFQMANVVTQYLYYSMGVPPTPQQTFQIIANVTEYMYKIDAFTKIRERLQVLVNVDDLLKEVQDVKIEKKNDGNI